MEKINTATEEIAISNELTLFATKIMLCLAAIVGVWGTTCLISGLSQNGIINTALGLIQSI